MRMFTTVELKCIYTFLGGAYISGCTDFIMKKKLKQKIEIIENTKQVGIIFLNYNKHL